LAGYLFLTLRFFRKILLTSLYVSCIILSCEDDPLAQSVEHLTFNQGVPRSSRGWVTRKFKLLRAQVPGGFLLFTTTVQQCERKRPLGAGNNPLSGVFLYWRAAKLHARFKAAYCGTGCCTAAVVVVVAAVSAAAVSGLGLLPGRLASRRLAIACCRLGMEWV
jgi:hypothetical protein